MSFDPEALERVVQKYINDNTPVNGITCHCGGELVSRVTGLFRGYFCYAMPCCRKCGRVYTLAENVATEGEDEFLKILREPITI